MGTSERGGINDAYVDMMRRVCVTSVCNYAALLTRGLARNLCHGPRRAFFRFNVVHSR